MKTYNNQKNKTNKNIYKRRPEKDSDVDQDDKDNQRNPIIDDPLDPSEKAKLIV